MFFTYRAAELFSYNMEITLMSFGGMLHSTYEFNKDNLDDYWMFAYENRNLPVDKG